MKILLVDNLDGRICGLWMRLCRGKSVEEEGMYCYVQI